MREIKARQKPKEEKTGFCRILYTQGAGRPTPHLNMEADNGDDVRRALAIMTIEYAKRLGQTPEDTLHEIFEELDKLEEERKA